MERIIKNNGSRMSLMKFFLTVLILFLFSCQSEQQLHAEWQALSVDGNKARGFLIFSHDGTFTQSDGNKKFTGKFKQENGFIDLYPDDPKEAAQKVKYSFNSDELTLLVKPSDTSKSKVIILKRKD